MSSWQRWTMVAVVLGSGIVFLDTSVVNLALPRIGEELQSPIFGFARLEAQSYINNGYFLTLSALLILAGALNDYFGRRRMFTIGLFGFLVTSILCGLAPNMELLILFRILQGATGALVVPGSLAIITASFDGEQQGRAFGLWAGAAAATVAFPIMMVKRDHPLVPPSLFRSRNFTVTNISTFVIYGALYVFITFQGLFLIGTLGYNEPAAGIAGLPATLFLVLFSTRFGRLAARYGPRLFMAAGPAIMALGLLYLVRFPSDSEPWVFGAGAGQSLLPPGDYLVDLLPSLLIFGSGLMMMVAPLTTALMTSVPKHNSGVGSAINNAISRVGSPLVTALIFVAVVSSFYGAIQDRVPSANTSSPEFRQQVAPLNPPEEGADPEVVQAAREASTDSFHLAVLVAAGLMLVGAAVNAIGIRNPKRPAKAGEPAEPAVPARERVDTVPEGVPCLPVADPRPGDPSGVPGPVVLRARPGGPGPRRGRERRARARDRRGERRRAVRDDQGGDGPVRALRPAVRAGPVLGRGLRRRAVRLVPRRDQRHGDVRRRALPPRHGEGCRPWPGRRPSGSRLQPGLPAVVLVRPDVGVPAGAAGEPAAGGRASGGAAASRALDAEGAPGRAPSNSAFRSGLPR